MTIEDLHEAMVEMNYSTKVNVISACGRNIYNGTLCEMPMKIYEAKVIAFSAAEPITISVKF